MSHRPNGARTHHCPWCGKSYSFSNFMVRRGVKTDDGIILPDVHQIACYRKRRCHSAQDGECSWESCPQIRDNEPDKTGRHCPLDQFEDRE